MKRYIVEIIRKGYREVEAEDCNSAEEIADNLNACDGVQWSDFVDVVRALEKDYEGKRWGDLPPEDRKFLLSDHRLTDIDAWEKGEYKEFTGDGMCFVDLNAECCCINGIVHDGQLYINEDDVIFLFRKESREERIMSTINIEEIHASDRLKKDKYREAKEAMRDILSDNQMEKFDETFDSVMGEVLKGVMMKEKS